MTYYQSAIVTIALSCNIFELFDVERLNNILTLKFGLEVTQGHWKWLRSIDRVQVPIRDPQ